MLPLLEAIRARRRIRITGLALLTLGLALLALMAPFSRAESPASRVGWLLALAAGIEALHALRRSTSAARRQATVGALISLMIALFLINAPLVAGQALRLLVAGWFAIDAARYAIGAVRASDRTDRVWTALAALGNPPSLLLLLLARGWALTWVVTIAGALRIFGVAWNIVTAPDSHSQRRRRHRRQPARALRRTGGGCACRRSQRRRGGACAMRSRLDDRLHRHVVRDPHGSHAART